MLARSSTLLSHREKQPLACQVCSIHNAEDIVFQNPEQSETVALPTADSEFPRVWYHRAGAIVVVVGLAAGESNDVWFI